METCVKHASVYIKKGKILRNVKRQHVQHVKLMKRMFRLQDNAVENALRKFVLTRMPKEKKSPLRLERIGIVHLNVKCALVKRLPMAVPKPVVNHQERHHGTPMVICVQYVNVLLEQTGVKRNVKRQHVQNVATIKSTYQFLDNAVENASKICVLIPTRMEIWSPRSLEKHGSHLNVRSAVV